MLVSLADIKTYLGETTTDYDDFLTERINIVSSAIENYCGRKFLDAAYTQTAYPEDYYVEYRSTGFLLYHFPLTTITSVVENDIPLTADEYRVHKPSGKIFKLYDGRKTSWSEKLVFTYNAGYATLPYEILSVVQTLVEEDYNKKKNGIGLSFGDDVQSIAIPGVMNLSFDYSLQHNERSTSFGMILGNQVNVLDFFRSERAVIGNIVEQYVE